MRRSWKVSTPGFLHLTPGIDTVPTSHEAGYASGPVWTTPEFQSRTVQQAELSYTDYYVYPCRPAVSKSSYLFIELHKVVISQQNGQCLLSFNTLQIGRLCTDIT